MYLLGIIVLAAVGQIGVGLAGPVVVNDVTKDTELLFVFLIHRHGDRTPNDPSTTTMFSTNPTELIAASETYGFGQLTKQGIQRAYKMGEVIRNRYDGFLSSKYNDSEIYIESTQVTRARMSVLSATAAVFPAIPGESWSDIINWEPVPYTSNDATYDPNMAIQNCPTFTTSFLTNLLSPSSALDAYTDEFDQVSKALNLTISLKDNPVLIFIIHDVLRSQINMGIPIPKELEEIFDKIEEAAGVAIDIIIGDPSKVSLLSGFLLKEFFDYSTALLIGQATPRFRWYSAHDVNVYGLESILKLYPKQGVPKYSSILSLEMRRDSTGNVFVLPVYVPSPEEEPLYLQVQGCDNVKCSLEQFTEILSPYTLDLSTWRTKCNWVETL